MNINIGEMQRKLNGWVTAGVFMEGRPVEGCVGAALSPANAVTPSEGEPYAVKVACTVRREGSGNGLADWRSAPRLCPYPTGALDA